MTVIGGARLWFLRLAAGFPRWASTMVWAALLGAGTTGAAIAQSPVGSAPASAAQADAPAVVDDYVIGPKNTLRVFVLRNPELGADVPVRPDGKITTPLVQDVVARQLARPA